MQRCRRGLGCLGVLVTLAVLAAMGMSGFWYGLMNTELPLKLIASAINESGFVEVEGVHGSFSSGMGMSRLAIHHAGKTSWMKDVSYSHSTLSEIRSSGRFVIKSARML